MKGKRCDINNVINSNGNTNYNIGIHVEYSSSPIEFNCFFFALNYYYVITTKKEIEGKS